MSDYFDSEADRESYRLEKFGKLLAGPNTDLEALGQLAWAGIPAAVRGTTWQLLLVCVRIAVMYQLLIVLGLSAIKY